jgi:hypothetical protein
MFVEDFIGQSGYVSTFYIHILYCTYICNHALYQTICNVLIPLPLPKGGLVVCNAIYRRIYLMITLYIKSLPIVYMYTFIPSGQPSVYIQGRINR